MDTSTSHEPDTAQSPLDASSPRSPLEGTDVPPAGASIPHIKITPTSPGAVEEKIAVLRVDESSSPTSAEETMSASPPVGDVKPKLLPRLPGPNEKSGRHEPAASRINHPDYSLPEAIERGDRGADAPEPVNPPEPEPYQYSSPIEKGTPTMVPSYTSSPPQGEYMSANGHAVTGHAATVTPLHLLSDQSDTIDCPFCQRRTGTVVKRHPSTRTHLLGGAFGFGLLLPCVPYLAKWCYSIDHHCSNCERKVTHKEYGQSTPKVLGTPPHLRQASLYPAAPEPPEEPNRKKRSRNG